MFKPFALVRSSSIVCGWHFLETKKFLPNTLILDSNILLDQGNNLPVWVPKNYSNKSYGELTFRRALETSNNLVTLKIGLDLGLNSVNEFLNKLVLLIHLQL